ncbi:MAG: 23S rRNA (uracil(1939)-C(5))-methyltransferase RlmD [Ruminococcaceae bacterium]|nr:23S rRNA (uracil(1939)-C(5))-methyltransferase RlmD [Oscillospiraceae bacterium]
MEKGARALVTIESVAAGGSGVCHVDGMTVFVPQTCPEDQAEIRIDRVKSGCAFGTVTKLLEASPFRRIDFCPVSDRCGGCDLAHISYEKQLTIKRQIVVDALERIGGFTDAPVCETLASPRSMRYRNKMVFPFGRDADGALAGGFYAPSSHSLVPLTDCKQGDETVSRYLAAAIEYLQETGTSLYDELTHRGAARRLFVRLAEGTKEAMVVMTANAKKLKQPELLVEKLLSVPSPYTLTSILFNRHTKADNLLLGKENKVLYGRDYIEDILGGLRFRIAAHSFYQINAPQTENLYNTALSLADLSGHETVLDLYCGIGTISLFAAGQAKRVIGVEIVPSAIENAKENAMRNNIKNAEFILGSAETIAPQLAEKGIRPDVICIDPPRKGADAMALDAIIKMAPEKVVYVSCNPATLARDAKYLCANGYSLIKSIPTDMFPNTSHIECCALLCRNR